MVIALAAGFTAAVALGLAMSPSYEAWCDSGEFGSLGRIPQALLIVALAIVASVAAAVGVVLVLSGRGGAAWLMFAAGTFVGLALIATLMHPQCRPLTQQPPTNLPATINFEFVQPYGGAKPSGPAECKRDNGVGAVSQVRTEDDNQPWSTGWRFGDPYDMWVAIELWPDGLAAETIDKLRVEITRLPEGGGNVADSIYSDVAGGAVRIEAADDNASGSVTFTNLRIWAPEERVGTGLPDTISGKFSWRCADP